MSFSGSSPSKDATKGASHEHAHHNEIAIRLNLEHSRASRRAEEQLPMFPSRNNNSTHSVMIVVDPHGSVALSR